MTKQTSSNPINGGQMSLNPVAKATEANVSLLNTCENYLQSIKEPTPDWLKKFTPSTQMVWDDFFSSRVVYYPGWGSDGEAIRLFASSKSAHCFVYVDYATEHYALEEELDRVGGAIKGYRSIARVDIATHEILSKYKVPHFDMEKLKSVQHRIWDGLLQVPFAFLEILERKPEFDDNFGADRIAVLFVGADGVATYDALFCQADSKALFALVLQDHGLGGNYTSFGKKGLMYDIAKKCKSYPEYLWVGTNTDAWDDYHQIKNLTFSTGGMHRNERYLFKRNE